MKYSAADNSLLWHVTRMIIQGVLDLLRFLSSTDCSSISQYECHSITSDR